MKISIVKFFIFLLSIYILHSCTKKYIDFTYDGEENHKCVYIVDTIEIPNPVKIYYKDGTNADGLIVNFDSINQLEKLGFDKAILRPDVYINGYSFYSIFSEEGNNLNYNSDNC